jgi:ribosomal protein S6
MRNYELTYLLPLELYEEEAKDFSQKIISFLQNEGGILIEEVAPLRRKLAYPVKGQIQAYLVTLNFQLDPEKLTDLEKKLKSEKQILRYLVFIKKLRKETRKPRLRRPKVVISRKIPAHPEEKKVELKDIDKKLDEIFKE